MTDSYYVKDAIYISKKRLLRHRSDRARRILEGIAFTELGRGCLRWIGGIPWHLRSWEKTFIFCWFYMANSFLNGSLEGEECNTRR